MVVGKKPHHAMVSIAPPFNNTAWQYAICCGWNLIICHTKAMTWPFGMADHGAHDPHGTQCADGRNDRKLYTDTHRNRFNWANTFSWYNYPMLILVYITLLIFCYFVCYSHHTSAIGHNVLSRIFMVEFLLAVMNCYPPLITLLEFGKQYYFVILHGNVTYKERWYWYDS